MQQKRRNRNRAKKKEKFVCNWSSIKIYTIRISSYLFAAILGAIISESVGINIWPRLLVQYDKISNSYPDPNISLRIIEKISNENFIDFSDKCDEFNKFLNTSSLGKKLPSNFIWVSSSQDIEKSTPENCEINSLFPGYEREHFSFIFMLPEVITKEDCPTCKIMSIIIANNGLNDADYIEAKLTLNDNWVIHSTNGYFAEKRDINTVVIYREHLSKNDSITGEIYIKKATTEKIDPREFIKDLNIMYGWRGMEHKLEKDNITLMYTLVVENCRANCHVKRMGDVAIEEVH